MKVPEQVIDLPWMPRRAPLPPNEHMVPFARVASDRIVNGLRYELHDRTRAVMERYVLPGGTLYMHPADHDDLLVSLPFERWRVGEWVHPGAVTFFGAPFDLIVTQDPAVVRRGRPRLVLDDGTEVLL